jgi:ribosomal-protein-serine acetyltransferase
MYELDVNNDIRLREIQMSDAPTIFSIIEKDRQYLRTWLPFVDYTRMVEDTEAFIKSVHAAPLDQKELTYVIIYKNQVAGIIGFRRTEKANHKTEIGYWLAEDMQGKGLVTLACSQLIRMCFEFLNMNRVQIKVSVDNHKSKRIPKQLGFTYEGIERDGEFLNDHYTDIEVYSLLKKEWLHHN